MNYVSMKSSLILIVLVFTPIKAMSLCVFVSSCAILQFKILFKIQLNSLKRSCLEARGLSLKDLVAALILRRLHKVNFHLQPKLNITLIVHPHTPLNQVD